MKLINWFKRWTIAEWTLLALGVFILNVPMIQNRSEQQLAEAPDPSLAAELATHCSNGQLDKVELLRLTDLTLRYPAYNLNGIEQCQSLRSLTLRCGYASECGNYYTLEDIGAIQSLRLLDSLTIWYGDFPLDPIQQLPALRSLKVDSTQESFLPFDNLPTLTTLDLSDNNISRINTFGTTTNLEVLDLSSNPLVELHGLASLTKLRKLRLLDTPMTPEHVESLRQQLAERGMEVDIIHSYNPRLAPQ